MSAFFWKEYWCAVVWMVFAWVMSDPAGFSFERDSRTAAGDFQGCGGRFAGRRTRHTVRQMSDIYFGGCQLVRVARLVAGAFLHPHDQSPQLLEVRPRQAQRAQGAERSDPRRQDLCDTNVLQEPDFRAFYCSASVSPAIEILTPFCETPTHHSEVQNKLLLV
jgi:hypothetical protein